MSDTVKAIAARILQTREALGMESGEIAAVVGIDEQQYLRYENAEDDIPIGFLTGFSEAFNIPLGSLLSGEEPKLSHYTLTPKGKGLYVQRYLGYEYLSLAHRFMNKKCEPFLVTVLPDDGEMRMNAHVGQEFDFVVEGKIRMMIGEKELILEEGDSVYMDSAYMHGMSAIDGPAKFLAIVMK